ncbi:aspartate-semialdehyde dehydrogenase [Stutzerimonas nosocomialis]|uniref:Aspartate-semialdehyde dehydrogenase n=1 Tax=Stutzerimonas nosocomialis TaxID=1056496 RepID=A0A5R9QFJ2_9GAMM|nr:aspartate-semialdehyde dehydrogenase [Stutzerimonas nosocomialis]TLX53688.1 aspartate-semialdehyde dehydrogenase [Stutzerimonas nosocomialis]TLX63573.1 aspartate-semialdehyde dehydrogenase [Stutzerimonas nosocomialis]
MLPPIPTGVIPVTAQQDVVKPRPDIAPVTPVQPSADESAVGLDRRHPQEAEEMLREEQRRRQRHGYTPEELAEGETDEQDKAELEELPRQGLWVDIEV